MTAVLGRFSADALESTLKSGYGGGGSDADLIGDLRFVRGVADLARTRYYVKNETSATQPILFLMHPKDPPAMDDDRSISRRHPVLDAGRQDMGGKIWFVNEVVNEGVAVDLLEGEDEGDIFDLVREKLALGDLPAVLIDLRDGGLVARYYPNGLNDAVSCQRGDLAKATLSLDEVREVLDGIYSNELCTPTAQGRTGVATTWADPSSRLPIQEAELMVQRIIKAGLTGKYLGVFNVLQEQPSPSGRYDLLIEQSDPFDRTVTTKHVLLELKVLREKTSGGQPVAASVNRKAIRKGLKQAAVYRDERAVRAAALCCFDMRMDVTGQATFQPFAKKALEKRVALWIWHLFASSDDYRDFLFGDDEISVGASN